MNRAPQWRPTSAEISLTHLKHNCDQLRSLFQTGAFFCPMIKANAYGHGAVRVAQELEKNNVTHFGVALIEEGEQLREAGIRADILVFTPIESTAGVQALLNAGLTPVVSDFQTLKLLQKMATTQLKLHFEFNTGMNRFGFAPTDVEQLADILRQNPHWQLEGLCTHFQSGSDIATPGSRSHAQLVKFDGVVKKLRQPGTYVHVLNSSAALALKDERDYGVRPGIALYGADPVAAARRQLDLKPVLSWKTSVIVIHKIQGGESVSYNATWTAARPSTIGVLPVGYADGYLRANSNKSHVLCRGLKAPVVGTVCMDAMMVDLTDVERQTGPILSHEPIVLIGEQSGAHLSATELAAINESISYEVLTRIGERVPRVYNSGK